LNRKRHPIFDSEPDGYRCQVSTSPDGKSRGYGFVTGPAVEQVVELWEPAKHWFVEKWRILRIPQVMASWVN